MRTLLSHFSEDFVRSVRPLLAPLEEAARGFASAPDYLPGREVLPELREASHQIEVLVDKVADQHAFVLIFGPLKSGKSTLMNALSSAYVSEVSSLPAYPCMVYVSHAPSRSYRLTRYDGQTETLEETTALQANVQHAHSELIDSLRRAEESGEEFDPAFHFPRAIRRIDVRLPAPALERSGAVLVDTPGLYSRMKFGYDRMTREFRNAAASAIFVVKSDNLFLEQVFDEFNELLDLFSRIFLIVNIDSTKQDLGPKGELVPSLEQEDPLRIVQAFENYAMSAPLKRAAEEGRLRIYPIDLLHAASLRLQTAAHGDDEDATADGDEEGRGRASFADFQHDLTQFLNSTDYLVAFIQDSIRRADVLLGELGNVLERDSVRLIGRELEELRSREVGVERRRQAVEKLSSFGWESAFDDFEQKLHNLVRDRVRVTSEQTSDALDRALEEWFQSDASLQSLIEDDLKPILSGHQDSLSRFVQETLRKEASGVAGGIRVSSELGEGLRLAEVRTDELARRALEEIRAADAGVPVESPLTIGEIPVRKRFADWVLLRGRTSLQRRLFGPASHPSQRIPRAEKLARLGVPAKEAMKRAIDRYKSEFFSATSQSVRENVLSQYASAMSKSLREDLESKAEALSTELAELRSKLEEFGSIQDKLDALRTEVTSARSTVEELDERHGEGPALVPHPRREVPGTTASSDEATEAGVESAGNRGEEDTADVLAEEERENS